MLEIHCKILSEDLWKLKKMHCRFHCQNALCHFRFFGTNKLKVERWFLLLTWMEQCLTPDSVFFPVVGMEVELPFPLQQLWPFLSSAHTSPRWQCPFILATSELAIICLQWVAARDQHFSMENTALNVEQSKDGATYLQTPSRCWVANRAASAQGNNEVMLMLSRSHG